MMIMLSRFDKVPERDRQTGGRTDGQNCYIKKMIKLVD